MMSAKKILLSTLPLPLVAIAGLCLVSYPLQGKSSEDNRLCANGERCDQARRHLREADQCFAGVIAGLRRVSAAQDRLVIGDRRLASRYIQRITAIREQLREVSEDADQNFQAMVLPEINPTDED